MEHPPAPPAADPTAYPAPIRGFAVASVALGFFSMIVFWWKPFGLWLASAGFILGILSLIFGNRGGLRGENLALVGTLICGFSLSIIAAIYMALGLVMWGYAPW
jgi:hypothetical protein